MAVLARIAALAALITGACYSPRFDRCQVRCAAADRGCPSGLECGDDNYCHASQDEPLCQAEASAIAAGERHTCAIAGDGVHCWGDNGLRQLGAVSDDRTPNPATTLAGSFAQLAAGANHTCAIDGENGLWCWGDNSAGQLGNGRTGVPEIAESQVSTGVGAAAFSAVSASWANTYAVQDTVLYGWGDNTFRQLGGFAGNESGSPVKIDDARNWSAVAAGREHACAIADAALYCWGHGASGQLGLGGRDDAAEPTVVSQGTAWWAVAAGNFHTCAIAQGDGSLWCWGANDHGQAGAPADMNEVLNPYPVDDAHSWVGVDAGDYHTCAVTDQGELYCFGEGHSGELGVDARERFDDPQPVPHPLSRQWDRVTAGGEHTCAVDKSGGLWCWGANGDGQAGNGEWVDEREPLQIGIVGWTALAAGEYLTCAIEDTTTAVALQCWGENGEGRLGVGDRDYRDLPTRLDATPVGWQTVAGGIYHGCAIDDDQHLWCWGANFSGEVGSGDTATQLSPIQPGSSVDCWIAVGVGDVFTCAIRDGTCSGAGSGEVYCWGADIAGALGSGGGGDNPDPAPVSGGFTDWTALWAGDGHVCAQRSAGLYCWGYNGSGELGNGTQDNLDVPTMIDAGAWTELAMSPGFPGHTCGIKGGKTYCWGAGDDGQLGTLGSRDIPTEITGLGTAQQLHVCAGDYHSCALDVDGDLRCWGNNQRGQLGDGTIDDSNVAVVVDPGNWWAVSCGAEHTCAIDGEGLLWCWGRNQEGQVGNGRSTPTSPGPVLAF